MRSPCHVDAWMVQVSPPADPGSRPWATGGAGSPRAWLPPSARFAGSLGAMDRSLPFSEPQSPHSPSTAEALSTSKASKDGGRRSPITVACGPRQTVCGTAGWGKWPMEAALPGVCDALGCVCGGGGGEAAAQALAASPKTLNFRDSHYNQGGAGKRAGWQMRRLPGCSHVPVQGEGRLGCGGTLPELLSHIYRSLCLSEPGAVRT